MCLVRCTGQRHQRQVSCCCITQSIYLAEARQLGACRALSCKSREEQQQLKSHVAETRRTYQNKPSSDLICKLKLRVVLQVARSQPYFKAASSKTTCNLSCENPHNLKDAGKITPLATQNANTPYQYLQHNNIFDPFFHQFFLWYKHFG